MLRTAAARPVQDVEPCSDPLLRDVLAEPPPLGTRHEEFLAACVAPGVPALPPSTA